MKFFRNIFFCCLLLSFTACEFGMDGVNINPNQPEEVSLGTILPGVIISSVDASVNQAYLVGNNAAQLSAKALRREVDIYIWASFANLTWTPFYNSLRDVQAMEQIAAEEGHDNYLGVAMVMRAWMFSVLTDAYGDIPYSQALAAQQDINFPAYDRQEDIYLDPDNGLLATLNEAQALLTADGQSIDPSGDLLFQGNITRWKRFANTLKMRLLTRVAEVEPAVAGPQMEAIVSSGIHMLSNDDNALLPYLASPPYQYPLMPLKVGDFDAVNISATLVGTFNELNDPRLTVYARPLNAPVAEGETATYSGLANGDASSSEASRLGYAYYDYPGHRTVANKADGIIMTFAELNFILAEAAERGWIGGDPEAFYRAGIEANMAYYGITEFPYTTPGGATTLNSFEEYYNQDAVSYGAANDKLARIGEQKWIALFFHGLEPWLNWKRTGYPDLQPTPDNENNDQIPVRFLYPGEEQSLNNENYQAAVEAMGGDDINLTTWWDGQ